MAANTDCTPAHTVYGGDLSSIGCLPHTGLDVWPLILIGIVLIALGVALAIYMRRHRDA